MVVLITGAAGFIGFHLARRLAADGFRVVGVDNLNDYYDIDLKYARLERLGLEAGARIPEGGRIELGQPSGTVFYRVDIRQEDELSAVFAREKPDYVVHLAAQAGVRHSLRDPRSYVSNNIAGFLNVLESCRAVPVRHLVYASSSSVYGGNEHLPFSVRDNVDHPVSLYAASKKSNELMAHVYSHLHGLPATGLRFFTVYGPWGRPDMALFLFTRKILAGEPIDVYNHGRMKRDFTYIDDVVEGVARVMEKIPGPDPKWDGKRPDPSSSRAPYRLFNIGSHRPVGLLEFIDILESALGRKARRNLLPLQPGDVEETYADIRSLKEHVGFEPATPLEQGVRKFVEWYKMYFQGESS
jgi:UDP-glucuronate 4-epimerase